MLVSSVVIGAIASSKSCRGDLAGSSRLANQELNIPMAADIGGTPLS